MATNPGTPPDGEKAKTGGCLNFGWGCLPVVALLMLPMGLLF